jgi:5-methyltetrahydrofolate--homocysteine methyltransferase
MTTTMTEMEDIILQAHAEKLPVKIIVGGAVLTAAYAEKIRADAYVSNAGQTPAAIRRLLD